MKSIKVCEYSRSMSFHDDLVLQDQASGERSQDQWSSGLDFNRLGILGSFIVSPETFFSHIKIALANTANVNYMCVTLFFITIPSSTGHLLNVD